MFLNLSFSNEWWNTLYGISSDKDTYMNPIKKLCALEKMDSIMHEKYDKWRFLAPFNGKPVSSPPVVRIEPYGDRFIPAMFGSPINYQADQAPWANKIKLDRDYIMSLQPITEAEFAGHPLVKEIIRQRGILMENGSACMVQQNSGSVMNTAMYLRGEDLFYDFYDDPEMIHKLFDLITNMILMSYDTFCKIDGRDYPMGVGNCSVGMLSPDIYTEFVRPYDMRIMEHARTKGVPFAMHHDSRVDPFITAYKSFDYLKRFDIGCDTDTALLRREFPDAIINVYIYIGILHELSSKEIFDYIVETAEKGGPLAKIGFTIADVDEGVSTDKIESICAAYAFLKDMEGKACE